MALVATFEGVTAKLRRANEHFKVIDKEISEFIGSHPYRFISEYDEINQHMVAKARLIRQYDRHYWATIIGDCVHNMRSALDHLAHQLLSLDGGTPKIGRGGTAFPIYDTSTGPKGGQRSVEITGDAGRVTGSVLAFVEGVQPYNRLHDPHNHPLWILSELDNMDKHRTLALTSAALSDFGLGVSALHHLDLRLNTVTFSGPFDETTNLGWWTVTKAGPNPYMQVNASGTFDIAFGATTAPAAGRLVLSTLDELANYVSNIIEILKIKALRQAGFPSP